jgi:hypothetical protein
MALAPDDIIRVTWRSTAYNELFQWQQHYRVLTTDGATGTLASLFGIASYFAQDAAFGGPSALTAAWLTQLGNTVQCYAIDAQRLLPAKTIYVRKDVNINGSGGTGPRATNTCSVFSLVAAVPGRKNIAKYHIGPLPDSYMNQGALSSAGLANLIVLGQQAQLIQSLKLSIPNDCTLQPVILHRSPNANPRFVDVASYRYNYYVRTQRKRTVKVGK